MFTFLNSENPFPLFIFSTLRISLTLYYTSHSTYVIIGLYNERWGTRGYCKFTPYIYFLLKLKMPSSPFTKHSGTYSQKRHKSSMYPITYSFPSFQLCTYICVHWMYSQESKSLSFTKFVCMSKIQMIPFFWCESVKQIQIQSKMWQLLSCWQIVDFHNKWVS